MRASKVIAALVALLATTWALPQLAGAAGYPARESGYHDYAETYRLLRAIEAEHPDIVRVFRIGRSYQGRGIWAAEVSDDPGKDEGEPEVMFDGLHHAREHLTVEMSLYVLRMLVAHYGEDTDLGRRVTRIVDGRRIWIIPMVNPDGLQYDLTGDPFRQWRKNRQPNGRGKPIGTDLNRNYDYAWGRAPTDPASQNYRGRRPFSAPETRAIRDFVLSRRVGGRQRIRAHISFHTAGEYVLWPYGHTYRDVPPDMTRVDQRTLAAMGRHMAATNGYRPRQSSDMYPTYGDEIDWLYGTQRIFSYTFEMFPRTGSSRTHVPDERIARETKRNREAVLYLMEMAACPYAAIGWAEAYCGPLYDDLEVARGWRVDAGGTDTARAGAWARGVPAKAAYQLGSATSGRAVLVTGRARGHDVDRGRTTVRSRAIRLPADATATLRLRYWVGMSSAADAADRFRVRLVDPGDGDILATALAIDGDGRSHRPAWRSLAFPVPGELRGARVAVELVAVDSGRDATVEAGVDDVQITVTPD
ncbi:MAG: M14 family metallopeptidase [Chloroflexota bacterium]